ncbi:glucosidase family protein [Dysgonomonas termitidis]|uniref:Alpha-L-rhamnosidase six-hairpin glycosidase domain-containing protein n=1 Tax=Dysgonomonas termitidis TaxID=1516126 RepID=A0ABV9KU37_9BACT
MKREYSIRNKINPNGYYLLMLLLIFIYPSILNAYNDSLKGGTRHADAEIKKHIYHNAASKTVRITDSADNLGILIDYSKGCKITGLNVKGKNTLSSSGVYTCFSTRGGKFSSCNSTSGIEVKKTDGGITMSNIVYGDNSINVNESWDFKLVDDKIFWKIDRRYSNLAKLEETAFPQWSFASLSVWKGGILDNGGMVWCKYLATVNDTYGVHTGGVTFWNPDSGDALRIAAKSDEKKYIAAKYSQSEKNEFTFTQSVTDVELEPRYNLNRFVEKKADVFSAFDVQKGNTSINLEIQYIDYEKEYSRGKLPAIDAEAVRELLNTTGRYGVVDNNIVGANGWTTNWKCLHEPFFAQIGMALNDENYTRNLSSTLDQERNYAITADGRVLSRWHNADDDQMPGTFNYKTGYYEARWGYTVDSQTGYIINTAEQFDLCGDIDWLRSHKESCEKALGWLIKRDSNNNGIFEMVNSSIAEQKASDWLDIVWASFENGFVNAQMYEALRLWANCELILGDKEKSDYYFSVASRLKENFNKPVDNGGFWSPQKKQYVYWRDKDGTVHGDNLVTPVNFAVIAFGLCDDKERIAVILNEIEKRTVAEKLFHWPLCFDSYKREEVHLNNWPFPKYENGDIFPTWGYLGIRAYVGYNKETALKYIRNILEQYNKDGLSSQRYSRDTQLGQGSDILAGICTSITALYRDIYGIRPKWNRMGVEPNMLKTLNGTEFSYKLRGTDYHLALSVDDYTISTSEFTLRSKSKLGVNKSGTILTYYPDNKEEMTLAIDSKSEHPIYIDVISWKTGTYSWKINSKDDYGFSLTGLIPEAVYKLLINGRAETVKADKGGRILREHHNDGKTATFILKKM